MSSVATSTPPSEPAQPTHPFAHALFCGPITEQGPCIVVVDPASRKLSIPLCYVYDTQGLARIDRVPSLCMLHLQGRCRQAHNCHQLHADVGVVEHLRAEISNRPSCCIEHGDIAVNVEPLPPFGGVVVDGMVVSEHQVSYTKGLAKTLAERAASGAGLASDAKIPLQKTFVCRLHVSGRCRYAEDCNFLHVCRALITDMMPSYASLPPSPIVAGRQRRGSAASQQTPPLVPFSMPPPTYAATAHATSGTFETSYSSIPSTPPMSPMRGAHGPQPPTPAHKGHFPPTCPQTPIQDELAESAGTPGPWKNDPYNWQWQLPPPAHAATA
jgi:hypothetical protein